MIKKIFIGLAAIILISLGVLVYREFWPKKPVPDIIELPAEYNQQPLPKKTELESQQNAGLDTSQTQRKDTSIKAKPLNSNPLGFAEINYPFVYAYDYSDKKIKAFNLEEKTYQEFYVNSYIDFVSFSPLKNLIAFREKKGELSGFKILDLTKDKIYPLDIFVKSISWSNNNTLFYYFSNDSSVNYIGKITFNLLGVKNEKVANIGIIDPRFYYINNQLLIAGSKNSPVFLINTTTKEKKVILDIKPETSFLAHDDIIFVNETGQNKKSGLIDFSGRLIKLFDWQTFSDKCSFSATEIVSVQKFLICGTPKSSVKYSDWIEWRDSSSDILRVVNLEKLESQTITIEGNYDVIKPQLTPLGIIFTNRIDAKMYLIPMENLFL